MNTRKIYLATKNPHKLTELRAMIKLDQLEWAAASDLNPQISWVEDGHSFEDNARIKALAVKQYTKDCALADDSGLCVEALHGAPGIHSSSYAGREGDAPANNQKLLQELAAVPNHRRGAKFVCCLCFIDEMGAEYFFRGECLGQITEIPRGNAGFGYDPLFWLPGLHKTMAELSPAEKNSLSHRALAFNKFRAWLVSR